MDDRRHGRRVAPSPGPALQVGFALLLALAAFARRLGRAAAGAFPLHPPAAGGRKRRGPGLGRPPGWLQGRRDGAHQDPPISASARGRSR